MDLIGRIQLAQKLTDFTSSDTTLDFSVKVEDGGGLSLQVAIQVNVSSK